MVRPDPLEGREAPKDLRYILATLAGGFLLFAGAAVLWNVIDGGGFSGNVGSKMSYAERIAASMAVIALGAGLLFYASRGASRLNSEK